MFTMSNAPPTDKTGRCIGNTFRGTPALEDVRSLLRDGDTKNLAYYREESSWTGDPLQACASSTSSNVDNTLRNTNSTPSCPPEESQDGALRDVRMDLEFSNSSEKSGYRVCAGIENDTLGCHDQTNRATVDGQELSTLSTECISSRDRQEDGSEISYHSASEQVTKCLRSESDDDTNDRSYSSTHSSLFWNPSHYDKSKMPSILVSGIDKEQDANNTFNVVTDNDPALKMDTNYAGSTLVHCPHYSGELIFLLNVMRESGDAVNIKLYSGGHVFPGHKAVFAAGSPYLASVIESCSTSSLRTVSVEIIDLRPELVGQLVDFIYTAKIDISNYNAQEVLQQALNKNLFIGKSVEHVCNEYLIGQFSTETGSETSSNTGINSSVFSLEEDVQSSSPHNHFHDRNYPLDILYALNKQRTNKQFTDLVLKVQGKDFYCHRVILIAISPYFRAMLTSDMKESVKENVTLHDINADIFSRLLDFVYTCRLYINDDIAQDMMELACFLQLCPVISACSQYLKNQLAMFNCLGIMSFARMYNCSLLYDDAMNFVLANFTEVMTSDEFQDMHPVILSALISDDRLNVKKEESVYEAVMLWLKADVEERLPQLSSILTHVRLPLIDPLYYRQIVESECLLKQNTECMKLVQSAIHLRQVSGNSKHLTDVRLKLRLSMKTQVMVIVGGYDDDQQWVRDVWCFHPSQETWQPLAPFPGRNRRFGCIALGNDIYVVGGQADHGDHMSETLSDVWRYDSITDTWSQAASMNKPRHGHGLSVVNDKIYAVGGKMGWAKRFNDIEHYDPCSNLWTCVTRIKGSYLEKPCCNSLDGKLYVNGYFFRDPDIMHCYNPDDRTWESMYSFKRMQGDGIENAAVLNDFIYYMVYRGYDNYIVIYNPSTGEHMGGSVMPDGKYLFSYGMTVIGDKLYIAGGSKLDASRNVSYIQCYDPALNVWGAIGSIPYPLCEHGCVTIEKYIPNCE